jgi:hypothetical protein
MEGEETGGAQPPVLCLPPHWKPPLCSYCVQGKVSPHIRLEGQTSDLHHDRSQLGVMAHACNPSYSVRSRFKANPGQKRHLILTSKPGLVGHACHPHYVVRGPGWPR